MDMKEDHVFRLAGQGVDQNPRGVFSINSRTGEVEIRRSLDREVKDYYHVSTSHSRIFVCVCVCVCVCRALCVCVCVKFMLGSKLFSTQAYDCWSLWKVMLLPLFW